MADRFGMESISKGPSLGAFAFATLATAGLMLASPATAQFPAQDMDRRSLGFGYTLGLRGQDITHAEVASHEVAHHFVLAYAPIPYLALQAGLGMERFSVSPYQKIRFRGNYGFAPSLGIHAYSPFFAADILRGTAGVGLLSMSSEDDRGYRYTAFVANPQLGLIVSPTIFLDVTLGGRIHLVDGNMQAPRAEDQAFANSNIGRGYFAITLKSPFERAFLHVDMDFSPQFESDWSKGPHEAAFSLSVGAVLGWKGKQRTKTREEKPVYFPAYPELKDRQDKMAEELE